MDKTSVGLCEDGIRAGKGHKNRGGGGVKKVREKGLVDKLQTHSILSLVANTI